VNRLHSNASTPARQKMLAAVVGFLLAQIFQVAPLLAGKASHGAFGPEGPRMREQLWLLPSGDPEAPLRATLFRPARSNGPHRYPLVVINHGTDEATRLSVSMPVYYWLSRWFVERGYAVLLPQRRGHGATGGPLAEAAGNCDSPEHRESGLRAARDLSTAIRFMQSQPFIEPEHIVAAGVSTGGWASLALASLDPTLVKGVINFAGGRGGHAYGYRNAVCGESELVAAAGAYAANASAVPTIWFYSRNDSFFGPELATRMARAWRENGGTVEANILPAYNNEGHNIADDRAGWDLWGARLDGFIAQVSTGQRAPEVAEVVRPQPDMDDRGDTSERPTPASLVVPSGE
jgi:dienelactone hydrolase